MLVAFTPFFFVTLTSNKIRELLLRIALLRVLGSIVDYLVHHASCIVHRASSARIRLISRALHIDWLSGTDALCYSFGKD